MTPVNADGIPDALKAAPRWVVWRATERKGKPDKPPFDHRTGFPGDVTDPAVWMKFETALGEIPRYDGIGFAFSPRDDFAGIDLDRCIDDEGNVEPWAERIVDGVQSYTERSPSGHGLHVIVRGKLPPEADRNKANGFGEDGTGAVEVYDHARYFTVTGDHFRGTPRTIEDRGEELAALYREVFPAQAQAQRPDAKPNPHGLDPDAVLAKARGAWNGARFSALFDQGDLTRYGGDWSRADLALCSHLAFWTGGDTAMVDALFRRSAVMREKWDERRGATTYGERTINKAMGSMKAFYAPRGREPGDDAPEADDGDPIHRTDLGNARRLVRLAADDLRYCHPWGRWLVWTGDRWQVDETGQIYRRAREVVSLLHAEAAGAEDDAMRKAISAWALTTETERRLNSMVSLARHEDGIPILPAELDAWPWLLNCPNGTVDLHSGRLGPHVRRDHLAKRTGVPFDPDAPCPRWEDFLSRVMGGDTDMVDFLRRAAGYAVTGDVREHALFFFYGRGRNGKSTFLNTVQYVLGDYGITVNADLLTAKNQDEHPTGVADLQGRRFVATIEVEDGRRMAESLVKTLTGGDRIRARRMRQDFYEFDPTHKLFLAANHKPTVRGTDDGIWRRIKLVPFRVQIPDAEVDKGLPDKLKAEAVGILAWAVRGCMEWQSGGLREPPAVTAATADYRAEMDVLADFLEDRCVIHDSVRVRAADLYRSYTEWCKDTGNHQLSMNKFGRLMTDRGFAPDKSNSVAWRLGVVLRDKSGAETVPNF